MSARRAPVGALLALVAASATACATPAAQAQPGIGPVVHVEGPYRVLHPDGSRTGWAYAGVGSGTAFHLSPGDAVEVSWKSFGKRSVIGWCQVDGQARQRSGVFSTGRCQA